ncbi:MAG TPA: VOC family protein [Caulobacteraceae bacterium]|nr:VOC family protein [Caulobacteraceae bacterium]
MNRLIVSLAVAGALIGQAAAAEPMVGVRSVRVGAADVPKAAAFYQAVFGLKEVGRNERPGLVEIIMNWGATVDEARAARTPKVVIINQPAAAKAPVSNIVLRCTEIQTIVARARANGGTIEREPTKSATSGAMIAFVVDPAGNRIELIQEAG